ncbi:MAG: AAA family ATPase [Deferrisomatales bacterium]|nr:AAA family ATPase [Deferrisomatales bacterium]
MAIYDKPVRLLFRDMLEALAMQPGQILRKDQILSWFQEHYPDVKAGTVDAHIHRLSTNDPSRVNWNLKPEDDLFFRVGSGEFRLYRPESDPEPIRNRVGSDVRVASEAELVEAVRETPDYAEFQDKLLSHKVEREGRAWQLIQQHRGAYTVPALTEIFDAVDIDPNNQRWFGSLLAQPNRNWIFGAQIGAVNEWFEELLFRDTPVEQALDRCLGDLRIKGVKAGLATLLLYVKDPQEHAIWLPATEKGLVFLGRLEPLPGKNWGAEYQRFNEAACVFRDAYGLEAREVDWILTLLGSRVDPEGEEFVLRGKAVTKKKGPTAKNQAVPSEGTLLSLFSEFSDEYLKSATGQSHLAAYDKNRAEGRANFEAIKTAAQGGWTEQLTDLVLRTLLPHSDSAANRERGAWIHIAPSFSGDVKVKFENAKWVTPQDWPAIAEGLYRFVRRCSEDPGELATACQAFSDSPYSKGLQTGALTPILNALRPDDFCIVNSKPLRVLNCFTGTNHRQTLAEYPAINEALHELTAKWKPQLDEVLPAGARVADLFDVFSHWLVAVKKFPFGPSTRYWKIAPGADAWNWEVWQEEDIATIGWDDLGDLSQMSRAEYEARRDEVREAHPEWTPTRLEQVWKFAKEVKEGDRIVANHGTKAVLGIGTVAGGYYFVPGMRHGHRIPVEWDDKDLREVQEGGWKRTLIELDGGKFEALAGVKPDQPPLTPGDAAFDSEAFQLLAALHEDPTAQFYQAHKKAFQEKVEGPFQSLMHEVAKRLPESMQSRLETEKKVFSRILKNDYGKGGAWPFYWGAFFPKGGKRIQDAQLFAGMHRDRLDFGFYIGEYGSDQRKRFVRQAKDHRAEFARLLKAVVETTGCTFGDQEGAGGNEEVTWEEWLADPATAGIRAGISLRTAEVLSRGRVELAAQIAETFEALFPLVLLATEDDPLGEIGDFLEGAEPDDQPEYSLTKCAADTGLDEQVLERWVRAIERKKQAVLYGPPGTGKTYLAKLLANHLVGGSDGFVEFVQFHPTYAYEDFIQGIRPRSREDGGLDYPLVPGRFLEFCRRARGRKGLCVLIVDEINRANLSRVFGELMYLLEYRDQDIPLAGGERFGIPDNVRLIGTMNTADRSIALVDHALRRRFAFIGLYPQYEILERYHEENGFEAKGLIGVLKQLNQQIGDKQYAVGISYFLREDIADHLEDVWRMEIEPYMVEYFFDQPGKAEEFAWEKIKGKVLGQ